MSPWRVEVELLQDEAGPVGRVVDAGRHFDAVCATANHQLQIEKAEPSQKLNRRRNRARDVLEVLVVASRAYKKCRKSQGM